MSKEIHVQIRRLAVGTVGLLAVSLFSTNAASADETDSSSITAAAMRAEILETGQLPAGGTWVPYTPGADARAGDSEATADAAPPLVAPIDLGCPAGTTNYPSPSDIYNCVAVYGDNGNVGDSGGGYDSGLRAGRADAVPGGETGGFGLLHAQLDHGLTQRTIGYVIVNNAYPLPDPKDSSRLLYGLEFRYDGEEVIAVEVIIQPGPDTKEATPDTSDFGLVTAYCVEYADRMCPAAVNDSIG